MLFPLTSLDLFQSKGVQCSNSKWHSLVDRLISSIKKCKTRTTCWVVHVLSLTQHLMRQSHFIPRSIQQSHLDSSEISFIEPEGTSVPVETEWAISLGLDWLINWVINHIKEQIDNKWQVRKHPIYLGRTPPNAGDTLRNQLTLIYWRYTPNIPSYKSGWHHKKSTNTDLFNIYGPSTI